MGFSLSIAAKLSSGQVRSTNEDNYYRSDFDPDVSPDDGQLFLAVDGVGGNKGGAIASYIACRQLPIHFFASKDSNSTLVQRLEYAIKKTHQDIKQKGQENHDLNQKIKEMQKRIEPGLFNKTHTSSF